MSRHSPRRTTLLFALTLGTLTACQDSTAPRPLSHPKVQFAQGDNNTWTVTTLADPGDGVCDETDCTLREAIEAPVLGGNIVFASGLQGSIKLAAGSGSLTIPKNIKIDGDERITLDAVGGSRVLIAGGGINTVTVWLKGLGITGGVADSEGGGILAARASLILDHVTVFGNRSTSNGGGIDLFQSDATIVSSTISDNVSAVSGGGIYVNGGADLTLLNSTVFQNTADVSGGGIYNNETATVVTSTIVGNRAGSGGGLSNAFGSTGSVVGSTFSGNAATYGGGIGNSGTLQVRSSTVVDNVAESGAGVLGFQSMTVANSIIAGNRATVLNECDGSVGSLGHNLTAIGGCTFLGSGDVSVPVSAVFTEVLEPTLKDNGGPTQTHALIVRGRAVDRGYCPGETTDQRGFARPVDDATMPNALDACDIGAYELQGPVAAVADLMISQSVDKPSAKQGDKVTYTVRVQNLGPQTAPNVVVNDILSSGATFVEARSNVGALKAPPKGETGTVTWTLGDLLNGADEAATITVTVIIKGKTTITNVASVTGAVADPNAANNSASIAVAVGSGGSTKGGRKN